MDRKRRKRSGFSYLKFSFFYITLSYLSIGGTFYAEHYYLDKIITDHIRRLGEVHSFHNIEDAIEKYSTALALIPEAAEAILKKGQLKRLSVGKKLALAPIYFPQLLSKGAEVFYKD